MAKMLDFNAIQAPTWDIKLKDGTAVRLSVPTVEFVDRLTAIAPEIEEAAKSKDGRTIKALYEFVADVMNNNEDGFTFTAEELRDKYRLSLYDVTIFFGGYFDFIKEIQDAKN